MKNVNSIFPIEVVEAARNLNILSENLDDYYLGFFNTKLAFLDDYHLVDEENIKLENVEEFLIENNIVENNNYYFQM